MSTRPIRLFAVTSVPEGKAAVQRILGELEGLPDSVSEEIELVGLAFNRRGAVQQMSRVQPDVLLVDLMLTGLRSIEIISEASAKLPDMKILALAPSDPPHDLVILALQAGATGYFTTDTEVRETATAIRQALNGKNGLLRDGASRHGEQIEAVFPLDDETLKVEICHPVFIDPEGELVRA